MLDLLPGLLKALEAWVILSAIVALLMTLRGINRPPQSVRDEVDRGIG